MKQYKGYCIDNVIYHNEAEIDEALKNMAIKAFENSVRYFANHPTMEASVYSSEKADCLAEQFGMSWAEIEGIEINALKTA